MLKLNPRHDGFGFIYGTYDAADGATYQVNIMPPESEWRGDFKLDDHRPHPTEWVI
jgi:hypothetical protein